MEKAADYTGQARQARDLLFHHQDHHPNHPHERGGGRMRRDRSASMRGTSVLVLADANEEAAWIGFAPVLFLSLRRTE